MRRTLTLTAVSTLVLALAACGGSSSSSDKGSGGGSDSSTTTTEQSGSGGSDFAALAAKGKNANIKASYKSGKSDEAITVAQYNGDSFYGQGGDGIYSVGGKSYTCSTSDGDAQCFELPGGGNAGASIVQGLFGAYAGIFDGASDGRSVFGSVDKSTSTETIAGRKADCVKVEASTFGQSGSVSVCIDHATGYVLRVATSADAESVFEATAFSESTADDVKLPAEPQAIPGQ
jgi:hypothetical protein